MPSAAERLATLEATVADIRHDLSELLAAMNGGGGVDYTRSVRGRLHTIEGTLAGMVLRRSVGVGMIKGWQGALLLLCGIATAAAAWYSVLF